jgi:pyruvate ferredoxin oxidoreductase beta subunit
VPVEEYLKVQRRFRHLFRGDEGKAVIERIQQLADENIEKYGLLA